MNKLVSIVVPAYNEVQVLSAFHARTSQVIAELPQYNWEILFVNDGSKDDTENLLNAEFKDEPQIKAISELVSPCLPPPREPPSGR